jgi:hypothetical protein
MTRLQTVEPGRVRPAPVEQKPDQYVSGTTAWNLAAPAGTPPGPSRRRGNRPPSRTGHGNLDDAARFLKAAAANKPTPSGSGGSTVVHGWRKNRYEEPSTRKIRSARPRGSTTGLATHPSRSRRVRDFGGVMFPGASCGRRVDIPVLDSGLERDQCLRSHGLRGHAGRTAGAVTVESWPRGYYLRADAPQRRDRAKDHIVSSRAEVEGVRCCHRQGKYTIPSKTIRY